MTGPLLLAAMPEIDRVLAEQLRRVTLRAMLAVTKGELTPDMAQNLWMEYAAIDRLARDLNKRAQVDQQIRAEALTGGKSAG